MKLLENRTVALLAATTAVLGSVAADAADAVMGGTIPLQSPTEVSFTSGAYRFGSWPCASACVSGKFSAFRIKGSLKDTADDGNNVFLEVGHYSYSWAAKIWNKNESGGKAVAADTGSYTGDPAQIGKLRVCCNRGLFFPNNCTTNWTAKRK